MPTPINISASRGAAILGLSNWTTQIKAWLQIKESRFPGFCEKHNYELPVVEYSPAMQWGHAFENAIIELAERKRNDKIIEREAFYCINSLMNMETFLYDFADLDFITCHTDGRYKILDEVLHEGKTTSIFYFNDNFGEPGTDQVPIEYQIQCQHQMICTGAEKVILSVLVFPRRVEDWEEMGWEIKNYDDYWMFNTILNHRTDPSIWAFTLNQMGYFHQYEITANKELQDLMIQHYAEFWNKYIIGDEEPKPCSYDDIKLLCREPVGTIIADTSHKCTDCKRVFEKKINECPACSNKKFEQFSIIESLMAEYKMIKKEIGGSGTLGKRAAKIKVDVLNYMRENDKTIDTDTEKKWILRDRTGNKIASFNGNMFR